MRVLFVTALLAIFSCTISAQDLTGSWQGDLNVPGGKLPIVFNFVKNGDGFTSTMDSPKQGVKGIPVSSVQVKDSVLQLKISNINATYEGKWSNGSISGQYKQNGMSLPLVLERITGDVPRIARPQEPAKPFPYYTENVSFVNNAAGQITLAGTLSMPAKTGKYPVVVLISGSGPQNRDEELFGHKPFFVLADHLTRNGIAVLRYDERGTGESTGKFEGATTPDFASDVRAAIDYLKTRPEIDQRKLGLIGHSEGGLIAPMIAAKSEDVHFIVLLSGPGLPGDDILLLQTRLIGKANGVSDEMLNKGEAMYRGIYGVLKGKGSAEDMDKELTDLLNESMKDLPATQQPPADKKDAAIAQGVRSINTPWNRFFVSYDPATALEKVKCPVLALNGENDLQVPPKENLQVIKKSLEKAGNKNFVTKQLPGLNHLFQESKTGSPAEYAVIEQTFSPQALSEITSWVLLQTKK